jgi:hypothetical protein
MGQRRYRDRYQVGILIGAQTKRAPGFFMLDLRLPGDYQIGVTQAPARAGGYRIAVGCRWFTRQQAEEHWSGLVDASVNLERWALTRYKRARIMLELLPKIHARAKRRGWVPA